MADDDQRDPVDQLIDMFVYAPVGMLYEYQEVLPKLVRRGKSQVQIAKVIGQLALNRNRSDAIGQIAGGLTSVVARQITEFGEAIGLAPKPGESQSGELVPPPPSAGDDLVLAPPPPSEADSATVRAPAEAAAETTAAKSAGSSTEGAESEAEPPPLPIARYDELTAKEIIALLADLEPNQLDRIRTHEEGNRARKTVLGKLDRLAD